MFVHASLYKHREENQQDATECFIACIICSACFRHLYAHHQELETIFVLLLHMVCNTLVAGGRQSGAGQQAMRPGWGKLCDLHSFPHPVCIACCSAPDRRPPATKALHTICDNNTNIVSSSWWWAYKCLKHVEQIICAIRHSVASCWFSSLRLRKLKLHNCQSTKNHIFSAAGQRILSTFVYYLLIYYSLWYFLHYFSSILRACNCYLAFCWSELHEHFLFLGWTVFARPLTVVQSVIPN